MPLGASPKISDWLPITKKEVLARGWHELDVVLVSGDAYVDHPSFGTAVIGRIIEQEGFRVGIIPQPNWRDDLRDFKKFGAPRLFFGVTAGCMDSMVNRYTANKRLRSSDAYTPGGEAGFRPDNATIVYSGILKQLYPDTPVVIGGIEASLRRVTHYDYWEDRLRPTILEESGADLLLYGMAEKPIRELLKLLDKSIPFSSLRTIPQTAFMQMESETLPKNKNWETFTLASHQECLKSKKSFAGNFKIIEQESNRQKAQRLVQQVGEKRVVINPPYPTLTEAEIDASFDLPFTRLPHPKYAKRGPVPAFEMIRFSVNLHRGCFGGCSFCTISAHQGKFVVSRSERSIFEEVEKISKMTEFKGTITDLGGPSANMYAMKGINSTICQRCVSPSCIFPSICKNLDTSHKSLLKIYRTVQEMPGISHVFVGSGIRYDLLNGDPKEEKRHCHNQYIEQVVQKHVSGRLKVAPEHTSDTVLRVMRKPPFKMFRAFKKKFDALSKRAGLSQQLIPYFISSHPGCRLEDMAGLAHQTSALGYQLEQVQDFTPTPMTVATVMYYSGLHSYTLKPIYVAKSSRDKLNQRKFFFWYKRENKTWIEKTLARLNLPQIRSR